MAQELGKIERPTAESFAGTRKLFLVPLVYSPPQPPADYVVILERYWVGARNQVRRLVDQTGPIRHIYHEGVTHAGDAGQKLIEQISPRSYSLIDSYVKDDEAQIEASEDAETFYEMLDWQRCLMSGLASRKVMELAMGGYRESSRRRVDLMAQRIDETLKPGESGILLIPEEHHLQFPKDIQVIFVAPPALDDVHRWIRDQQDRERRQPAEPPTEAEPSTEAERTAETERTAEAENGPTP